MNTPMPSIDSALNKCATLPDWMLPLRLVLTPDGEGHIYTKQNDAPGSMNNFAIAECQQPEEAYALINYANQHAALTARNKELVEMLQKIEVTAEFSGTISNSDRLLCILKAARAALTRNSSEARP